MKMAPLMQSAAVVALAVLFAAQLSTSGCQQAHAQPHPLGDSGGVYPKRHQHTSAFFAPPPSPPGNISTNINAWTFREAETLSPSPRFAHSAAAWRKEKMLVFGGATLTLDEHTNQPVFNCSADLWLYDSTRNSWQQINATKPGEPSPIGRASHSSVVVENYNGIGDDALLIYGGYGCRNASANSSSGSNAMYNDVFNTSTYGAARHGFGPDLGDDEMRAWMDGQPPLFYDRIGVNACGNKHFGENRFGLGDAWALDLTTYKWTAIGQGMNATKDWPGSRHLHAHTPFNNSMLIFGGFYGGFTAKTRNDLWTLSYEHTAATGSDKSEDGDIGGSSNSSEQSDTTGKKDPKPGKWVFRCLFNCTADGDDDEGSQSSGATASDVISPVPRANSIMGVLGDHVLIAGGVEIVNAHEDNSYVEVRQDAFVYSLSTKTWAATADLPQPLAGATGNVYRAGNGTEYFVTHGGVNSNTSVALPAILCLEIYPKTSTSVFVYNSNAWVTVQRHSHTLSGFGLRGTLPAGRQGHSSVVLTSDDGDAFVIFGGVNTFSIQFFNDLWALHDGGKLYTPIRLTRRPPPTSAHASVSIPATKKVYMFGGWQTDFEYIMYAWIFTPDTQMWDAVYNLNISARAHVGAVALNDSTIILYGGAYNNKTGTWVYFDDTYLFNVTSHDFVKFKGKNPGPRAGHTMVTSGVPNSLVYMFGGKDSFGPLNDVWTFGAAGWKELTPQSSLQPVPRWGHASSYLSVDADNNRHTVIVAGGRNITHVLSDMWGLMAGKSGNFEWVYYVRDSNDTLPTCHVLGDDSTTPLNLLGGVAAGNASGQTNSSEYVALYTSLKVKRIMDEDTIMRYRCNATFSLLHSPLPSVYLSLYNAQAAASGGSNKVELAVDSAVSSLHARAQQDGDPDAAPLHPVDRDAMRRLQLPTSQLPRQRRGDTTSGHLAQPLPHQLQAPPSPTPTVFGAPNIGLAFSASVAFSGGRKMGIVGGATRAFPQANNASIAFSGVSTYSDAFFTFDAVTDQWHFVPAPKLAQLYPPRIGHTLVQLNESTLMVSCGQSTQQIIVDTLFVDPGCSPGYSSPDFMVYPCTKCPIGTYASAPGQKQCTVCNNMTTTREIGATSISNCSICPKSLCHGNGNCIVDQFTHLPQCRCYVGFLGSKRCKYPIGFVWLVAIPLVFGLFVFGVWKCVKMSRTTRTKIKRQAQELKMHQDQVRDLQRDWLIDGKDLTLVSRIDSEVQGTFAEVYLGEWHNHQVAVKKLKDAFSAMSAFSRTLTTNFEREIRILRRTRHRNVVIFYGAGWKDGCNVLVMEYCEKGSVQAILMNKGIQLSKYRRRRMLLDAARGMNFLHSQSPPQVHRDLKSANLLVTESWVVKVADLGTARLISELKDSMHDDAEDDGTNGDLEESYNVLARNRRETDVAAALADPFEDAALLGGDVSFNSAEMKRKQREQLSQQDELKQQTGACLAAVDRHFLDGRDDPSYASNRSEATSTTGSMTFTERLEMGVGGNQHAVQIQGGPGFHMANTANEARNGHSGSSDDDGDDWGEGEENDDASAPLLQSGSRKGGKQGKGKGKRSGRARSRRREGASQLAVGIHDSSHAPQDSAIARNAASTVVQPAMARSGGRVGETASTHDVRSNPFLQSSNGVNIYSDRGNQLYSTGSSSTTARSDDKGALSGRSSLYNTQVMAIQSTAERSATEHREGSSEGSDSLLASKRGLYFTSSKDVKMTTEVGTVAWMAPEVMKGDSYGTAVDVFSYGIVMWEFVNRSLPYFDLNIFHARALMKYVLAGNRPPTQLCAALESKTFVDLMVRCWDDSPSNRPDFTGVLRVMGVLVDEALTEAKESERAGQHLRQRQRQRSNSSAMDRNNVLPDGAMSH